MIWGEGVPVQREGQDLGVPAQKGVGARALYRGWGDGRGGPGVRTLYRGESLYGEVCGQNDRLYSYTQMN